MPQLESQQFDKFQQVLRELFVLDQADLDFGLYRLMNEKRQEIEAWLSGSLRGRVEAALRDSQGLSVADKERELQDAIEEARTLGADPDTAPRVRQLREAIDAQGGRPEDMANEVYDHLATFFARYYSEGDFISQRRYKKDVYAIPYEGEEVKLHWANADQYYIKTAEHLRDYHFRLSSGRRVSFHLREAGTEQNNNKAPGDQRRLFALYEPGEGAAPDDKSLTLDGDELSIAFTYQLQPKATRQRDLVQHAYEVIKGQLTEPFYDLLEPSPTKKDEGRTLLQKHLANYVARNQFDYFIHKDLRGFLTRELDFYVKSEMLVIDDLDASSGQRFLARLAVVKATKMVGAAIIDFLASIEDYQKRLWEKRKFVTQADYCITLDHIDPTLYPAICANDRQREEWVRLFAIDRIEQTTVNVAYSEPLTEQFLAENPFLPLDTALFAADVRRRIIEAIDRLDEKTNGLLVNSENFQALRLLQERWQGEVKCIYIDPPYNTGSDGFTFKDGYQHSTWLAMMRDRLALARQSLADDGAIFISIDDNEQARLKLLCDQVFGEENFIGIYKWNKTSTPPSLSNKIRSKYEYIICYEKSISEIKYNGGVTDGGDMPLLNESNSVRKLIFKKETVLFPKMSGKYEAKTYDRVKLLEPISIVNGHSTTDIVLEGPFKWVQKTLDTEISSGTTFIVKSDKFAVRYSRLGERIKRPSDAISKTECGVGTNEEANKNIMDMFGSLVMSYPKPTSLISYLIPFNDTNSPSSSTILDFFAGSGTTGHAVINLNREDGGARKYLLVEMGDYFDSVTKPRVLKAAYSKEWKDGLPVGRDGVSQIVKYLRLEQYEDTLNNLVTRRPGDDFPGLFEQTRRLGYLLDSETRESLFNLQWFDNPFDVRLRVTRGQETREQTIDLVETFNYLLGLRVERQTWPRDGLCTVEGRTTRGETALVIWRDVSKVDNDALNDFFAAHTSAHGAPDRLYVNGDNRLQTLRPADDPRPVRLIEEVFQQKMFEKA